MRILNSTRRKVIRKSFHNVKWPVQNVLAFTTTRHSPSFHLENNTNSLPPFDHFNLGLHVGDKAETVLKHRKNLLTFLPKKAQIQWLEQVHGADVLLIDKHDEEALIADAAITRHKNIALAIMTADCLPILLTAKDGSEIAAIHGGWKPLQKNIITNTLNKMNTANENVIAWLGPCIGKKAFEVGEEVKLAFVNQSSKFLAAFSVISSSSTLNGETSSVKYLADLALIAKIQLSTLGIKAIHHLEDCTYSDKLQYFSYRRESVTGRMASIICLI